MKLVFDIEADGLQPNVSKVWCLVAINPDTNEQFIYSDYDPDYPSLEEGLKFLSKARVLAGHNICGYDLPVLKQLFNWEPPSTTKCWDTWIMSQTTQYKRKHKHGLEGWGAFFSYPKLEFNDFSQYTKEMLTYCIRDVELNVKVYNKLKEDALKLSKINPMFLKGLEVEMEFSRIEADIRNKGWVFDLQKAYQVRDEIANRMAHIEQTMEPKIGMRTLKLDKPDEFKEPKWRKDGCYAVQTAKYFGIEVERGKQDRPIEGNYCRVEFAQASLGSLEIVKDYLYSIGWVPDEWNVERINGKFVNKSPKLTESSLEPLGEDGLMLSEYLSIRNRKSVLEGWIEQVEQGDGRLHGKVWTVGTPTFRCRHEVIANLPSVGTPYGEELRSLLTCEEGTTIVGADSAGNQMRGLCHYIGNEEFTNEVINGDVHQRNADVLGVSRKTAKPFLYAYLFGAGAGKIGLILTGKRDAKVGQAADEKFKASIPGLGELKSKLSAQYNTTANRFGSENAYIRGLDGRLVFVNSEHQVLNYLLQTAEGITCKAAMVYARDKIKEAGIDAYPIIHYHDEMAWVCQDKDAERVKDICVESFREAPKWFGVNCMDGDGKIGKNYAEVH